MIVPAEWPTTLPALLACVAEAPGIHEEIKGRPLCGPSGKVYNKGLGDANIQRQTCLTTNVFASKLPRNSVKQLCGIKPKAEGEFGPWLSTPVETGAYLPRELAESALTRLRGEVARSGAKTVIAFGATALWALCHYPPGSLSKVRGAPHACALVPGLTVFPTYHPAYVLRKFTEYPFFWSDLVKARRFAEGNAPASEAFGTFTEIKSADEIEPLFRQLVEPVACDIETSRFSLIDCIGFSDGVLTFSVPFFENKSYRPFWDEDSEIRIRREVIRWLESPVAKIWQNGSYDLQVLAETWHVRARGYCHDTRLLSHALWPELKKDLGTLASLHTALPSWKPLRHGAEKDEG